MDDPDQLMRMMASIIILGVGGQWLAWRLRVPAILLLLTLGCLAGSVSGFINPDQMFGNLLQPIVSLAVGLILFKGGLNLRLRELKGTWKSLLGLLTIGAIITWFGAALGGPFYSANSSLGRACSGSCPDCHWPHGDRAAASRNSSLGKGGDHREVGKYCDRSHWSNAGRSGL